MCTRIRKGIINPNYPGFQSLAYTLNEDNFDYSSENPSDDDEDSYVSESDDNEMKQRDKEPEQPGDENGNSYGDNSQVVEEGNVHPNSTIDIPVVRSNLYHPSMMTTSLESEEFFPSDSSYRRTRMHHITDGRNSPTLTTAMFDTEEQLETTLIYACTPPDIVLQHSYDHRSIGFGSSNELANVTLELSTSQKPDLIPEQQSVEQRSLKKNSELETLEKLNDHSEQDRSRASLTNVIGNVTNEKEDDVGEHDMEQDDQDDRDAEGNRSPPSPAIELLQAVSQISIYPDDICSNLQPESSLHSDNLLNDRYGSPTAGEVLSEDSEQESDEGEFEYKPYEDAEETRNSCVTSPRDVPASDDSGDSAGSSPGEVQYHLVDDCSNQTVQITRSRQTNDQSPTNPFHLLQHYSTSGTMDYHNNSTQLTNVLEHEINRNDYYSSLTGQSAQTDPSGECGRQNGTHYGRIANRNETVSFNDYSDARPSTLQLTRREANFSSYSAHTAGDIQTSSYKEKKNPDNNQRHSTDRVVPANQFQKVPKVNPFCEALLQENDTCDFFTKQAKLQIEARMALCQAKDMAHMQMEFEKRSLPLSPVTRVIHTAVEKAGLSLAPDKRRLSRYYLTRLNVHQLQTILTELQGHAEVLNEELVELLMERDDLHISQDATLIDIEDLSRYLCAKEQTIIHAERQRKSHYWSGNRVAHHQPPHPKQPSLPQPPIRSTCGTAIPAYRYH
uniref:SCHIP-1 domain-containing protein n=1 Tax=Anopheles funestus TaxID=62324 RepID=A0A182RX42_ANOFN